MPSSTSHSKGDARLGRAPDLRPARTLAARLVFVGLVAWASAAFYTLILNPEIRHFKQTHAVKHAWAERMTREHGKKVVVYGGSSCEFSIDGERLLERFQLPCANLGRGAGMGATVLTMAALEETRPGDTLIVALEPGLLTDPLEIPSLGCQFSIAVDHWDWIRHPLAPAEPVSFAAALLALRPGGLHTLTMAGKLLSRQPLYRYRIEEMHLSGWNQTPVRLPISGPPGHGDRLGSGVPEFLQSLQAWCRQRDVRLAYSLPWGYTPEERVPGFQKDNLRFLLQINALMPVLKDARLGAYPKREHFSDTVWHLTEEGAALRTDALGEQIRDWNVWTTEELERALAARP